MRKLLIKRLLNKLTFVYTGLMLMSGKLLAGASMSLGDSAKEITKSMSPVSKLITGGCYVAGLAFMVGAIMQFKQHKDNPTQVTIGKPIALLLVGAALLFMPSIMGMAGVTIFGSGTTAGPSGAIFSAG